MSKRNKWDVQEDSSVIFFPKGVFCLLFSVRLHVWAVLWCFTCYFQLTFNCFPQFLEAPICSVMTSLCPQCVLNKKVLPSSLQCALNCVYIQYNLFLRFFGAFKQSEECGTTEYFMSHIVVSGYILMVF